MKKYIFSVLMAAMAVFTFSSCEDVPAPYGTPNQPSTPDTPEVSTDGTEANPYTVTDAKTVGSGTDVFVKGYIVGFIPDKSLSEAVFSAEKAVNLNVIIATSADETDVNKCMPVQLPAGDIRTAVNLKDNAANLGQEVLLCGNLESYFGAIGVKSTSYAKIGSKEVGKKPGSETGPIGEAKGTGTEADPFNSVAAYNEAVKLAAGSTTDQEYYIKGKLIKFVPGKSDTGEFNSSFGNASFMIADDETSTQFYIFRTYYFGGEKWKEGDTQLKVGDEVVVCGKLTNYNGILETAQGGKLISINGKGGSVTPTPDPTPDAGDGMTSSAIISGKTSTEDLPTNAYGSQSTENESTWYSWKYDNVAYTGAKICKAPDTNGGGIQLQGSATDATKQGFFFNTTAFSKDIKSITIVVRGASKYATPTIFNVYEGSEAHPTTNAIEGKYTKATEGDFNIFTMTYDFSAVSSKYFTVWNNAVGVLYIDKLVVTLK